MSENDKNIKFAEKVVISLVKSPLYSESNINLDQELKEFFQTTQIFKPNDYFFIKNIFDSSKIKNFNLKTLKKKF